MDPLSGFDNEDMFPDLTVRCGERTWKVHKVVMSMASRFFFKACTSPFKEAQENLIILHDDDPLAVECMLRFCYTRKYSRPPDFRAKTAKRYLLDIRVYILADKYDIKDLAASCEIASKTIHQDLGPFIIDPDTFVTIVKLISDSIQPDSHFLKLCMKNLGRDLVLATARPELATLNLALISAMMKEIPEYTIQMLQKVAEAAMGSNRVKRRWYGAASRVEQIRVPISENTDGDDADVDSEVD